MAPNISATLIDGAARYMAPHDNRCFVIADKLILTVRAKVVMFLPSLTFVKGGASEKV